MFSLILGLVLFILLHLVRELGVRQTLMDRAGSASSYKGLYSLLALVGLGLIIWGKVNAPFVMVWQPKFELRFISHVLMIPAMILVIAGNIPLSYLRQQLRNPMLGGVTLWGLAHLWSNGDLASMLLFGGFAAWAGLKFVTLGFEQSSQAVNQTVKPSVFWDIIAVVVGLILYVLISRYHGQLFGVGLDFV